MIAWRKAGVEELVLRILPLSTSTRMVYVLLTIGRERQHGAWADSLCCGELLLDIATIAACCHLMHPLQVLLLLLQVELLLR